VKALILITRAELGGGQTHVADLLRGLRDEFDLELGTGEQGYLTEIAEQLGVPWHVLPDLVQPISPLRDLKALHQCLRLLRRVRPDVIHAHTSKAGVIGRLAGSLADIPSIFTAHTWCFAEGTSWKWRTIGTPLERMAARVSSRIITVSNANRDLALEHRIAGPEKFVTVHNGIPDCPPRAPRHSNVVPRIVMVARFSQQKAQSLLVEALAGLNVPFRLAFVGEGPLRQGVQRQVEALGLTDRVDFLGQRMDIPEILETSDIFALFTKWEGFPISILEAMRAGLPVVASDVNGVREAVTDGHSGFLIPPGAVHEFRDRLSQLLQDAGLRRRMGLAGRRRFEREFTANSMIRKTATLYWDAIGIQASPKPSILVDSPMVETVATDL
jgi:glycosyltransferase involved in cell wall biosynthesis